VKKASKEIVETNHNHNNNNNTHNMLDNKTEIKKQLLLCCEEAEND